MVNKERVKLWIEALESGEYQQTNGVLCRYGSAGVVRYCCLGVACEVAIANGLDLPKVRRNTELGPESVYRYGVDERNGYLPHEVTSWFGFDGCNPIVGHDRELIAITGTIANDSLNWSFEEIADKLGKYYEIDVENGE